ncbi:MAG: 50S ribosomal protein L28 [Patescibacteria group bacterium]
MSKQCVECGKAAMSGNNVSHSHRRTKRSFKVNLQLRNIQVAGQNKKALLCSRCIKSLHKEQ